MLLFIRDESVSAHSEISEQLLDGSPWTGVRTFTLPSAWTEITCLPSYFTLAGRLPQASSRSPPHPAPASCCCAKASQCGGEAIKATWHLRRERQEEEKDKKCSDCSAWNIPGSCSYCIWKRRALSSLLMFYVTSAAGGTVAGRPEDVSTVRPSLSAFKLSLSFILTGLIVAVSPPP